MADYSDEQLRSIIREAVHQTLVEFGVDVENPLELQKDFAHLRDWRKSTDELKSQGAKTVVMVLVMGLLGLGWAAIKGQFWPTGVGH